MARDAAKTGTGLKMKKPQRLVHVEASVTSNHLEINVMSNSSTAVSNVIPFSFEAKPVRTLLIDGEAWFVASDVCAVLELSNTTKALYALDDDERSNFKLGRQGEVNVINESGLYTLILRCRDAVKKGSKAHAFRKWVTSEVLPAIRKNGRYEDNGGQMDTLIGQTIGTDGFHMLGAVIKGKVVGLPKSAQRRATMKIWAQTHVAFGVRSAADIPADKLDAARNFIAAYVLEGEYLPSSDLRMLESMTRRDRYMVYLDSEGNRQIMAIPDESCVMSHKQLIKAMVTPGELCVASEDMFEFAAAAIASLKKRYDAQAWQLKQAKAGAAA